MESIQLFRPTFRVEECLSQIRECLEVGWTGLGFKTNEFENAWKEYTGLPHAHFLNSATAGLHLALELLKRNHGWDDGDEVITTPLTFVSTNHAILLARLRPVFADVDSYLCLDPQSVAERITGRTRAIMFVGLGGNTGQLGTLVELARERGLKLVLDAAHMAGTRRQGHHVGSEADVTVFSFQAVKNLPTADAGMICFADARLDAEVRKWSWLGINKDTYTRTVSQGAYKWYYDVEYPGFNYHGNSIMAAIGLISLRYLDHDNAYRRQLAQWYTELIGDHAGIAGVPVAPDCESARHLFQIQVERRNEVMVALNSVGVFPGVHYRDNTVYPMYAGSLPCPNARRASERLISLPLHLCLSRRQTEYICDSLVQVVDHMSAQGDGRLCV